MMPDTRSYGAPLLSLVLLAAVAIACGRKADPLPPDLVRPERITSLKGEIVERKVRLQWTRPSDYTSGKRMDDLGGFYVYRGRPGAKAEKIAEILVDDRERFRRQSQFLHTDEDVGPGEWYYRVVSFTTDGYFSGPSNQVNVEILP